MEKGGKHEKEMVEYPVSCITDFRSLGWLWRECRRGSKDF